MFCREQAAHFQAELEAFDALGVRVVAIGNGTAVMAADFVETFGITFPVYSDPSRAAFAAAGMRTGLGLGLASGKYARRAMRGGLSQGRIQGAPFQQGGVLLVDGDGQAMFQHADKLAGAHMAPSEVLETIGPLVEAL